ncbi:hypothetical protein [Rossellomorea aquimaris]|uniref:Uncharacterized protein n=1 Tax=Rossellomorea aquimaris TaxID=189382 RepID=A0A366EV24_9BACI|nr:hypothetical protein [Rossellomorea aquimaris]RBP05349.1 hypothetical protein DET59_10466 [Rossellomorea aquimaris]
MIGGTAISLSLCVLPIALVSTPIQNFQLFWVNLFFVALIPTVFLILVLKNKKSGLILWNILLLDFLLLFYVFVILKWMLNVF